MKALKRFEERRSNYLAEQGAFEDVYLFGSGRELVMTRGDIRTQPVQVIVSSDDQRISMGGGVSAAIALAAGTQVRREAKRFVPVRQGRAIVTSAGDLPIRFIFHGVTLDYSHPKVQLPSRDVIAEIVDSCFYHAETFNVTSIAFPLLGTGTGGFSRDVCLETMFRVLSRLLLRRPTCVKNVRIVIS